MIRPRALKPGDYVGVVAPSDAVEKSDVEKSREILENWGLKVKIGRHVYSRVGDFAAGTAEERMEDLQAMLNDPEVRAIWAAGGGYAATEILPAFNREIIAKMKQDPQWLIGYSDVCLILNGLTSFGIASVMGPNMGGLYEWDARTQEEIRKILSGEEVNGIGPEAKWQAVLEGTAEGRVVASNLETLILSFGTRFDPIMYGSGDILLGLEELDIDKSTLQRQVDTILNHKRASRIKAVFVGRLTNITELSYPEWGQKVTAEGLITERVKKFGVPLAFCQDFGHPEWVYGSLTQLKYLLANKRFFPIVNGIKSRLTVSETECKLEYLEKMTGEEAKPVEAPRNEPGT